MAIRKAVVVFIVGVAELMGEAEHDFRNATIRFDSYVRGPDQSGICLYAIEGSKGSAIFEVGFEFAENGNDFWVVISNFGIRGRTLVGSTTPLTQQRFSRREADEARQRITVYFSGSDNYAPFNSANYSPFKPGRAGFLGIKFDDRWIVAE